MRVVQWARARRRRPVSGARPGTEEPAGRRAAPSCSIRGSRCRCPVPRRRPARRSARGHAASRRSARRRTGSAPEPTAPHARPAQPHPGGQLAERPPRMVAGRRLAAPRRVRGSPSCPVDVDREASSTDGRHRPGRLQNSSAGPIRVGRSGADLLGSTQQWGAGPAGGRRVIPVRRRAPAAAPPFPSTGIPRRSWRAVSATLPVTRFSSCGIPAANCGCAGTGLRRPGQFAHGTAITARTSSSGMER